MKGYDYVVRSNNQLNIKTSWVERYVWSFIITEEKSTLGIKQIQFVVYDTKYNIPNVPISSGDH